MAKVGAVYKPRGNYVLRGLWRYFITGRPVYGPGDNATFLRDATIDHRGGPAEKLTRARWRRVARRWAGWIATPALAACDWRLAVAYVLAVAGYGITAGVRSLAAWWPQRAVRKEYVVPAWTVTAKILGMPVRRRDAVRCVQLPDGFGTDEVDAETELSVRIHLPLVQLDEGTQKRIAQAAGQRLGIADPSASWVIRGTTAHVDLSPKVGAPRSLTFGDVRQLWLDASDSKPLVGMGPRRTAVYADLDNDGPHIGISGPSGTGKSTLLRIILAKRASSGAGIVVCDYKVNSHPFLRRLAKEHPDRAVYAVDEEPISEAIMAVFGEFQRRRELLKVDASALEHVRPIDLVVEEVNSLADMLRKWWGHERRRILAEAKAMGEDPPYVPVVPPCVDALAALVQMGRELLIRCHFAAQRLDASALSPRGGGAVRESISNRFLAGYTKAAWNMLCAGVPYQAFPGGPRGLWTACVGGQVTFFRVPPLSHDEAYELAMTGPTPSGPVIGAGRWVPTPAIRTVTLSEAWELIGAPSLQALRQAVQRAKLVPAGRSRNAHTYDVRELQALYQVPRDLGKQLVLSETEGAPQR